MVGLVPGYVKGSASGSTWRIVFFLAVFFWCLLPVQASDWPTGWSQVTPLNPVSINSSCFGLDVSNGQEIILSWVEGSRRLGRLYMRRLPVTGEPQKPLLLAEGSFFANPRLCIDDSGYCHIVWEGRKEGQEVIYYTKMDEDDAVEVPPQILFSSPYLLGDMQLLMEKETLYLFWSGRDEETMHFDIFMMPFSLSGQPQREPVNLTRTGEISGRNAALIQDGMIHLIWTDYVSERYHLLYQSFTLEGEGDTAAKLFDTVYNLGSRDRPSLAPGTEEGVFHLLYSGDATAGGLLPAAGGLFYGKFTAFGLERQRMILEGFSTMQRPYLTRIAEDRLGILWQDNRGGPLQVHYLELDERGDLLTEVIPLDVTTRASHAPKMLVDGDGELFVFWFAFDEEGRNYQLSMMNTRFPAQPSIWYRIGLDVRHPMLNLLFVLLATFLLGLLLTFIHVWVYGIPVFLLSLFDKKGWLEDPESIFYPFLFLLFTLLFLLQGIYSVVDPVGSAFFFQLLGALLSSGMTLLFIRGLTGFSLKSGMHRLFLILLWLFWFHYFTYLPQVMAWL